MSSGFEWVTSTEEYLSATRHRRGVDPFAAAFMKANMESDKEVCRAK